MTSKNKSIQKRHLLKVGLIIMSLLLLSILLAPLPDPVFQTPYATTLRSQEGILLSASIARDQQWRFPQSDSIPNNFSTAIQLFEDEYFRWHPGVNPISITRAMYQNFRSKKVVSGGSTLSMQTVRMALGNQKRTYFQKFGEILSAFKLELLYSKREILKLYADHAPFGGNIVGINAAAWRYFGRSPFQLSWAEVATLAILPNDPSSIFPGKNQEALLLKRNFLLQKIASRGHMTKDELFLAMEESLPETIKPVPNDAYHLLHRAMTEGSAQQEIHSTLDASLQREVSRRLNIYSRKMAYNKIENAAAVILDIESGNTLAYVGNSTNRDNHGQHVDIINSRRSPGSLLKPFLYALSLDEGLITPHQLLPDIPVFYKGFSPKNFDKEFRGAVHADQALISSLNVPFVHLLMDFGYEKFHQRLRDIGFYTLDKPAGHYGLSLILGGAETTLWEISGAYASMARSMYRFEKRPYRSGYSPEDYHENRYRRGGEIEIENENENGNEGNADGFIRVASIRFALEAMQQVNRPDEENGWEQFTSARKIAWKTGTSYGLRDGWAIGLNDTYLVGVWIGNADGEGRPGLTGVGAAAPLMFELFDLLRGESHLVNPFGLEKKMCKASGMLAGPNCPETYRLQLPDYLQHTSSCQYHTIVHLNEDQTNQVNSSCYSVAKIHQASWFVLPPGQSWYYKKYHPGYRKLPPYQAGCEQSNEGELLALIYPDQSRKVHIPKEQGGTKGKVIFEAAHENKDARIFWHVDETFVGTTQGTHQQGIQAPEGLHTLTLIDDTGNEIRVTFEVLN